MSSIKLSQKNKQKVIPKREAPVVHKSLAFSGPIPPPDLLAQYNHIHPGLAERIVTMAEEEGRHRREQEKLTLNCQDTHIKEVDKEAKRGQIFALTIAIVGIISGVICSIAGSQITGSIISGSTILSIVSVFIYGRWGNNKK